MPSISMRTHRGLYDLLHKKLNGKKMMAIGTYLIRDPETYKKAYDEENPPGSEEQWEKNRKLCPSMGPWEGPYPPLCSGGIVPYVIAKWYGSEFIKIVNEFILECAELSVTIPDNTVFYELRLFGCGDVSEYMLCEVPQGYVLINWFEGGDDPYNAELITKEEVGE